MEHQKINTTSNTFDVQRQSYTLETIPKSNIFTQNLPADAAFPTPSASHSTPRESLGPRIVKNALYTFVRPEPSEDPELLCVSQCALEDTGLDSKEADSATFKDVVAGNRILTLKEEERINDGIIYPWAQCYGGYQFGQWAGQLGDGRAISLFETTNPHTSIRYEIQLKGAGRTPYSRFADGKAVLRSSIREFVVSEYLNAIGIPTTRALALTLCQNSRVIRERVEPGAIVTRFAQSWIRLGTFDLLHVRGDRKLLRRLADFTAEHVYGGWDKLSSGLTSDYTEVVAESKKLPIPKERTEGEGLREANRYARLYRAIVRNNALTVAKWQAYGFVNGVLNTDNTSILGLSLDFGPFAFLDTFNSSYTPNHDDHALRYSYRNQKAIIWWNLARLGEALGELMGAGSTVDSEVFIEKGIRVEDVEELRGRAEGIIERSWEEYEAVFMAEYRRLMAGRLGLKSKKKTDFEELLPEFLEILEEYELDFHHAFRRLSSCKLTELTTEGGRQETAGRFFKDSAAPNPLATSCIRIANWLGKWTTRITEDWAIEKDQERQVAMNAVNPKFVPRSWILDELIDRVQNQRDRKILPAIMKMNLDPFQESWNWDKAEEERFCGDVPEYKDLMQCSCSS